MDSSRDWWFLLRRARPSAGTIPSARRAPASTCRGGGCDCFRLQWVAYRLQVALGGPPLLGSWLAHARPLHNFQSFFLYIFTSVIEPECTFFQVNQKELWRYRGKTFHYTHSPHDSSRALPQPDQKRTSVWKSKRRQLLGRSQK